MEPVELTAGRLHLRPWRAGDADAVLAACQDSGIQRWTTVPCPYTAEHARSFVRDEAPRGWADGTDYGFAVCDSRTGDLLAAVAVRRRAATVSWDVGYWTVPAARGRGVMSEALGVLCRWAYAELGAQRIEWHAEVGNWASRRVAEKAGFLLEGVQRAGLPGRGGPVDAWCAARLATDSGQDTRRLPACPALTDAVVTLRAWREQDAADLVRGYDDPERALWLPGPVPYGLADAQAYLTRVAAEPYDGTGLPLAVVDDGGALVGGVHLHLTQRLSGIGEIGYWTAAGARGRGVASRAARLLSDWALTELGLRRVGVLADPRNVASQRAAQKAGFVREGVLSAVRQDPRTGEPRDMVVFGRTR